MSSPKVKLGQRWRHKDWSGDGEVLSFGILDESKKTWYATLSAEWFGGDEKATMFLNNNWSPVYLERWTMTQDVSDE